MDFFAKVGAYFAQPTVVNFECEPSGTNRQQITAHEQDADQRSNCRSYGGRHSRGNSANGGRATPRRTRFLEEDPQQPGTGEPAGGGGGAGINQESYTIRRDEEYDSEQDEKSSNDSTSTRIISNSVFNFDRDRSRPPTSSSRPPSGAGSLKSASSGNLRGHQQYAPEGRGSRASNLSSYGTGAATIIKHHSTDNVSLRSGRCELDGISSNQVQYESDYDDDDDEDYDQDDQQERRKAAIGGTPKRYPTPSPMPLRASCSTDNLPDKSADEDDYEEEEAFEEMAAPKSRAQSASMGNLAAVRDLGDPDLGSEMLAEPPAPPSRPAPAAPVAPARKILKKPFLERRSSKVAPVVKDVVSSVKAKNKLNEVLFEKSLRRFDKPRDALANCLTHLESPNWEQNISGLQFFVRLIRHHPEVIDTQIHLLSVALSKQVRNLRSQVARTACKASSEFFTTHRRCIEGEAEDIATHLLHRTADTNKFLRADATQALESMCENLSVAKVVHIVAFKGATHQNAVVRTTAAKLLDKIVTQIGAEKLFGLPKETRDKLILTGAHLLLEGSLETRNYTKNMFKKLADHPHYSKVLLEVIPQRTYRNIEKALNSIRQMA